MEAKYTAQDLKTMQAWPLSRKIQVTQTRLMEWHIRFEGKCAVNFSGGIDSTVLLDLARRCYPDIPAVFVDTGIEYPEIVEFVNSKTNVVTIKPQFCKTCVNCKEGCFPKVVRKHGWNYPSKDVACNIKYARKASKWAIRNVAGLADDGKEHTFRKSVYAHWAFLVDSPFIFSDECCYILKEKPLNKWHKETGNTPIVGLLASESRRRRQGWLKTGCNVFDSKKPVSKPLSFWMPNDILSYIREFDIPYAKAIYGEIVESKNGKLTTTGAKQTGCSICPVGCHLDKTNKYIRMKQTHPDLWDYGINTLGLGSLLDYVGVDYGGA